MRWVGLRLVAIVGLATCSCEAADTAGDTDDDDCPGPAVFAAALAIDSTQRAWIPHFAISPSCAPNGASSESPTLALVSPEGVVTTRREPLLRYSIRAASASTYVAIASGGVALYDEATTTTLLSTPYGDAKAMGIGLDGTLFATIDTAAGRQLHRGGPDEQARPLDVASDVLGDLLVATAEGLVVIDPARATLRALDRDGAQRWLLHVSDVEVITGLAIDDAGRIYVASRLPDVEGTATCRRVTEQGLVDPTFFVADSDGIDELASLSASSQDGVICATFSGSTDGVTCFELDGTPRWSTGAYAEQVQVRQGHVWSLELDATVVRRDIDGVELWRRSYLE